MKIKKLLIRFCLGFIYALALSLINYFVLQKLSVDPSTLIVYNVCLVVSALIACNLMTLLFKKELPEHPLLSMNTNFFIILTAFLVFGLITMSNLSLIVSLALGFIVLNCLQNLKTNQLLAKLVSGLFILLSFQISSVELAFFLKIFLVLAALNLLLALFGTQIVSEWFHGLQYLEWYHPNCSIRLIGANIIDGLKGPKV